MAHPPRTGTQKALRITSIIMIIFGVLVALSGAIIIASGAARLARLNDAVNFRAPRRRRASLPWPWAFWS